MPPDEDTAGFWSVWKYDDIRAVSRNAKIFCSGQGMLMEDFPEVVATMSQSFLAMDDPEHAQLRALVSQAFTPRRMRTIEGWVRGEVVKAVDEMAGAGEGDFCELFAKQVPGRIFADFFGLPDGADARGRHGRGREDARLGRPGGGAGPRRARDLRRGGPAPARHLLRPRRRAPRDARRGPAELARRRPRSRAASSRTGRSARSSRCSPRPATTRRATPWRTRCTC